MRQRRIIIAVCSMNGGKMTFGDVLVVVGAGLLLAGLGLLDWRLALAAGGLLLLVMGTVRLRREN